jgi:hypothetical protein
VIVSPIVELFGFIWSTIAGLFRSLAALQAEILVLHPCGQKMQTAEPIGSYLNRAYPRRLQSATIL